MLTSVKIWKYQFQCTYTVNFSGLGPLSPKASKQLGGVTRLRIDIDELAKRNVELKEALLREQHEKQKMEEQLTNVRENGHHKEADKELSQVCIFEFDVSRGSIFSAGMRHSTGRKIECLLYR